MYKSIDGKILINLFVGGCKNLEANRATVDSLNVFPVPDGDTGTNMSMTIRTAVKALVALGDTDDIREIAKTIATASLTGARGNSGVILSQILSGFCSALSEKDILVPKDFVAAFKKGAKVAYGAVNTPKEGTILTVIRVIAEEAPSCCSRGDTFESFMEKIISVGENILSRTPEMLPVLKKAGVVDAGGYGLMCVLKGWLKVLKNEPIEEVAVEVKEEEADLDDDDLTEIKFAYCTEFFITNLYPQTTVADIEKLKNKLSKLGDSLICIGDLSLVKVHVHTNTPGKALQYAVELGELDKVKIENMLIQNRELLAKRARERKPLGIIAVCSGDGYKRLYSGLGADFIVEGGQSMNPSVEDFINSIRRINADNVIIFPNNKNITLAANQATELVEKPCFVMPTVNVQSGLNAITEFDTTLSAEDNVKNMSAVLNNIVCGTLTRAVRNASIDGIRVKEGNFIGLSDKKILVKGDDIANVLVDLVGKLGGDDMDVLSLYYGKDVDEGELEAVKERLEDAFPDLDVMTYFGGQANYYYDLVLE